MPAKVEQCEGCGKLIGGLETPWVNDEQVVCAYCWATLRIVGQAHAKNQTSIFKTATHSLITSELTSVFTKSAVVGLSGVAICLARVNAWWFHD